MIPRDSETLAQTLRTAARIGTAENDNHSPQLAINGLVWAYGLLAERADKIDVLRMVQDALDVAEPLWLDLSGLEELRDKLTAETAI